MRYERKETKRKECIHDRQPEEAVSFPALSGPVKVPISTRYLISMYSILDQYVLDTWQYELDARLRYILVITRYFFWFHFWFHLRFHTYGSICHWIRTGYRIHDTWYRIQETGWQYRVQETLLMTNVQVPCTQHESYHTSLFPVSLSWPLLSPRHFALISPDLGFATVSYSVLQYHRCRTIHCVIPKKGEHTTHDSRENWVGQDQWRCFWSVVFRHTPWSWDSSAVLEP